MITGRAAIAKLKPPISGAGQRPEHEVGARLGIAEQVGDALRHAADHILAARRAEHERGDRGLEREGGPDHAQPDPAPVRRKQEGDGEDDRNPAQTDQYLHCHRESPARPLASRALCCPVHGWKCKLELTASLQAGQLTQRRRGRPHRRSGQPVRASRRRQVGALDPETKFTRFLGLVAAPAALTTSSSSRPPRSRRRACRSLRRSRPRRAVVRAAPAT